LGSRQDMLDLAAELDLANNAGCPLGNSTTVTAAALPLSFGPLPLAGILASAARIVRRRRTV
jgi:hypothetical protein